MTQQPAKRAEEYKEAYEACVAMSEQMFRIVNNYKERQKEDLLPATPLEAINQLSNELDACARRCTKTVNAIMDSLVAAENPRPFANPVVPPEEVRKPFTVADWYWITHADNARAEQNICNK